MHQPNELYEYSRLICIAILLCVAFKLMKGMLT